MFFIIIVILAIHVLVGLLAVSGLGFEVWGFRASRFGACSMGVWGSGLGVEG